MKNAYPAVLTQGKTFIVVYVPDFGIHTQGRDLSDAIEMARDAIGLVGVDLQDDGEPLPEASSLADIHAPSDAVVSLVEVDFEAYRRENEGVK